MVISKFIEGAKEIEMDCVAKDGQLIMHVISEHVENAGVHSGDATLIQPPQDLDKHTQEKIVAATAKIAQGLRVTGEEFFQSDRVGGQDTGSTNENCTNRDNYMNRVMGKRVKDRNTPKRIKALAHTFEIMPLAGPLNIQFIAKDQEIKVIEANVRASRSFPYVSKALDVDLIAMATKAMMDLPFTPYPNADQPAPEQVCVKVPQFSFSRLQGADPILACVRAWAGEKTV